MRTSCASPHAAIALGTVFALASPAGAETLSLAVAPESALSTTIQVSSPFGNDADGPVPTPVSGGAEATLTTALDPTHGLVASSWQFTASDLVLADTLYELVILIPIQISMESVSAAFSGELLSPGIAVAANTAQIELSPLVFEFTEGEFVVLEPPGVPAAGTVFPLSGPAEVVTVPNGGVIDVTISIPISQTDSVTDQDITVDTTVSGTLVLEGTLAPSVPALGPASGVALAAALLAAGAAALRLVRRPARSCGAGASGV